MFQPSQPGLGHLPFHCGESSPHLLHFHDCLTLTGLEEPASTISVARTAGVCSCRGLLDIKLQYASTSPILMQWETCRGWSQAEGPEAATMVVHMLRLLVCQLRCSSSLDQYGPLVPEPSHLARELAKKCRGHGTLSVKHLEVASFSSCLDANARLSMHQGRLVFETGAAPEVGWRFL